ncbi:unnamed protein product [Rhizoctonia solani]|uniref:T6SS Phospholipase effector Tle1-like catalytic domain-containing protein n=1 Tax=Rhizoctonia solani TaxID=456999 RepID=A0A8H3DKE6_9AGAM|nr:unnamed protein product [Rhizoctonia solani]
MIKGPTTPSQVNIPLHFVNMDQPTDGQPHDDTRSPIDTKSPTVPKPPVAHDYAPEEHKDTALVPEVTQPQKKKRKLIVCIDGTSNQFSDKNTNVIEMYHYIKKDDSQLTYYNSGIGTYAKPSWRSYTYLKQTLSNTIDLAIAWNLEKVIIGAYRWLADTYQPDDQIFLFGFSRGAYQVRALAAMIESVGLIYAGNQEQIPFAWELYASHQSNDDYYKSKISTFKKTFSRNSAIDIHFLGVCHITNFRHALALDERRVKFLPEYVQQQKWPKSKQHTVKEVWFAGTHSDIGGGNKENPNLSSGTEPLRWMMSEAEQAGLVLHRAHQNIQANTGLKKNDNQGDVTESLVGFWWLVELLPISWQSHYSGHTSWWPHMGKGRKVTPDQKLHWTVLANHRYAQEINKGGYRPKATFVGHGNQSTPWDDVFQPPPKSGTDRTTKLPEWEGDTDLINALKFIKQLDQSHSSHNLGYPWLNELFEYITKPSNRSAQPRRLETTDEYAPKDQANIIWTYGGASFLRGLVDVGGGQNIKPKNIIRIIIGFSDAKLSKKPQLPGQQPVRTQSTISRTDTYSTDDSDVDNAMAIILRLNDLVPLCKYPSFAQGRADSGPQRKGLRSFFSSKSTPRLDPAPNGNSQVPHAHTATYSMELAMIVIQMILELLENDEYVDAMCSHKKLTIVQNLPLMIPDSYASGPADRSGLRPDKIHKGECYASIRASSAYLASQVVKAIVPIAKRDEGRQKLLNSGVTGKLLPLLEIGDDADKDLIFHIICAFRALADQEETADCLISNNIASPLVQLLAKSGLKEETVKETLNTLTLLTQSHLNAFEVAFDQQKVSYLVGLMKKHPEAIDVTNNMIGSRNFRTLLANQEESIVEVIQELLNKDDEQVDKIEKSLHLIETLMSHDDLKDEVTKGTISASLTRLVQGSTPAYPVLESMVGISRYSELMSFELLEALIRVVQSETGTPSKSVAVAVVATAIEFTTRRDDWYREISQSLISALTELAQSSDTGGSLVDTAVETILKFAKKGIAINNEASIQLTSQLLANARAGDYWRFGGYYDEIFVNVFGLVSYLSQNAENRRALLKTGVYEIVSILREDSATYTTDRRALVLVTELQDLGDDEVNQEIRKHDPYNRYAPSATTDSPSESEDTEDRGSPGSTHENLIGEGEQQTAV